VALHLAAIVFWHVPRFYDAALRYPSLHVAEHLSFLGSALLFWWLVCDRRARRRLGAPLAVAALFVVAMQGTVLGALLTVAQRPWYVSHLATTLPWGLTPLEDQQLAGLLMWVPAGLAYLVAAAALTASALAARAGAARPASVLPRAG
jgi:cytochrome c oxidase assembly factor CtaG